MYVTVCGQELVSISTWIHQVQSHISTIGGNIVMFQRYLTLFLQLAVTNHPLDYCFSVEFRL